MTSFGQKRSTATPSPTATYHQNEVEQSTYNFEYSDADWLLRQFNDYEARQTPARRRKRQPLPAAYELVLKAGHTFNSLGRTRRHFCDRTRHLHRPHPRPPAAPWRRNTSKAAKH